MAGVLGVDPIAGDGRGMLILGRGVAEGVAVKLVLDCLKVIRVEEGACMSLSSRFRLVAGPMRVLLER